MRPTICLLALFATLVPSGYAQAPQKPNPPAIDNHPMVDWTQQQTPQPVNGQYDKQKRPAAQTFTGMIVKSGEKYVLTTSDNVSYELDDQERASQFEGKQVQVTGNLDKSSNMIQVGDIKAAT
jgi:Protein of unknown function (DUF5818)